MFKQIENIVLIKKIGEGQFTEVYKGCLTDDNQQFYALKIYQKDKIEQQKNIIEMMENEIKALEILNSQYIIQYFRNIKTKNNIYLVYEYCNNGNLDEYLSVRGNLDENEVIQILKQILQGFMQLDQLQILHRDIKPSNLLFSDSTIKLGDFGFCIFQSDLNKQAVNQQKQLIGSPIYMSPELLQGMQCTQKSDVYALGVVLYEILFGKCPIEENSIQNQLQSIQNKSINYNLNNIKISISTQSLLMNMLNKSQTNRFNMQQVFQYVFQDSFNSVLLKNTLITRSTQSNTLQFYKQSIKSVMNERNKVVYLANVNSAIVDLNISYLSVYICQIFNIQQQKITNNLINLLKGQ